jgi:hypothetical protein
MFEFLKDEMEKKEAEQAAKNLFAKMISDAVLNSEKASEQQKLTIRVLNQANAVQDALSEQIVEKYIHPTPGKEATTELLKKVLEYLELVEVGIKQFSEMTPFEEHTEAE